MLNLDDSRWLQLHGGYRIPFDPRPLLFQIERDPSAEKNWSDLTEELFHQGDVGEASYAAVPQIVRIVVDREVLEWRALDLVCVIEIARHSGTNPPVPEWLKDEYEGSVDRLAREALRRFEQFDHNNEIRSALGLIAAWKGQLGCARAAILFSEDELKEYFQYP